MATASSTKTKAKVTKPKAAVAAPKAKAVKPKSDVALRFKQVQRAAILFKQVSDPTRLSVITMLSEGERHVGALCEEFAMSQPAVSHHLALLRHGGIISPRREGKQNFYGLTDLGQQLAKMVKVLIG